MKFLSALRFIFIAAFFWLGFYLCLTPNFAKATFNEFFVSWDFIIPKPGSIFIVKGSCPRALKRVIERAFPEYIVMFKENPQRVPHLILHEYYKDPKTLEGPEVPYLAYSGEYASLRWKRFLKTGYPFLEVTANQTDGENFIFMPYISYGKNNLRESITKALKNRKQATKRPYGVAYISSHCVKERDDMFKLLKERFGQGAISYGKCQHTPGFEAPGTYHDLTPIYEQFDFGLTMENHDRPGYVTEKIMNAFEGGAIPIYWGDGALAKKWFNPKAFINISDYPNFKAAADAIYAISQHPEKLKEMRDAPIFKTNEIPPLLLINDDVLTDKEEKLLNEMALKLRKSYEKYVSMRGKALPYLEALDIKQNLLSKLPLWLTKRFMD